LIGRETRPAQLAYRFSGRDWASAHDRDRLYSALFIAADHEPDAQVVRLVAPRIGHVPFVGEHRLLAMLFVHLLPHWEWIFATVRRRFTTAQAAPAERLHDPDLDRIVCLGRTKQREKIGNTATSFARISRVSRQATKNAKK